MVNFGFRYELKLMKTGPMKNQAFVTLQTVAQAQLALQETNGYKLKDVAKPIVVQFAKSQSRWKVIKMKNYFNKWRMYL